MQFLIQTLLLSFTWTEYLVMNKNQQLCEICNPHEKVGKSIGLILKRLIRVFKKNISSFKHSQTQVQTSQKQDFLLKIIDYFMLDISKNGSKSSYMNCQRHLKLKSFLIQHLNINRSHLEQLSQKIVNKILKQRFQLDIVIHLSKNLAKSKCLQESEPSNTYMHTSILKINPLNISMVEKEAQIVQTIKKNRQEIKMVKSASGSGCFLSHVAQEFPERQRTACSLQEIQKQKTHEEANDLNMIWNPYYQQYQFNTGFHSPFFFYRNQ